MNCASEAQPCRLSNRHSPTSSPACAKAGSPNEQAISQTECRTSGARCHGSRFRDSRGLRILQELGWDTWDTAVVWPEYQTGQGRTDCRKQQRRLVGLGFASADTGCHPERSERISVVSDSTFIPHPSAFSSDRRVYLLDLFERPPAEAAETVMTEPALFP